jgi:5'-nucleotidase
MKILLTNDDSHRSPLLESAARYLSSIGEVTIVVPHHEQSWTGKSITRFKPVHIHTLELFGRHAYAVTGTPSDCVNAAIHNILKVKPDLVVSGINAGYNAGLGFIISSGTVGACLEANLADVPAIALSQAFDPETRNRYISDYMIAPELIERFDRQTVRVLDKVFSILLSDTHKTEVLSAPVTWNINFPFELTDPKVLSCAPMSKSRYGACFTEDENSEMSDIRVLNHGRITQVVDPAPLTDSALLQRGIAALTPINLWALTGASAPPIVSKIVAALG